MEFCSHFMYMYFIIFNICAFYVCFMFYVIFYQNKLLLLIFCGIRTSSHWLEPKRGRYEGVARNERKCKYCNNSIGDEFYFVCICHLFDNIRICCLSNISNQNISLITFNNLLSSNNILIVRNLSLFIYQAFKMRQHFLNTLLFVYVHTTKYFHIVCICIVLWVDGA